MAKIHKNLHNQPVIRTYLDADYTQTHQQMLNYTLHRVEQKLKSNNTDSSDSETKSSMNSEQLTQDELWVVEHNDVYTLGQAGKPEHILKRGDTPIIQTDRGGQVTWHGTGQLVVYWLFDLERLGWSVRDLVSHAEQSIEDVINSYLSKSDDTSHYYAKARQDAPGVYIYSSSKQNHHSDELDDTDDNIDSDDDIMLGKIASLGFKIKRGFSYHGIAINLNCDLSVFNSINPCGYAGMQMLRLADFVELNSCKRFSKEFTGNSTQFVTYSIDKLDFTEQLLNNISARYAGKIELR